MEAESDGCTVPCSYSNKTSDNPHTSAANHGNTFTEGRIFLFAANFTRASITRESRYKLTCHKHKRYK